MANGRLRAVSSWIEEAKREREIEEDLLACRLIVLKIVRYMKENHLSQKELAKKLNVSPQYINKFLHGQDLDMKVSTVFRYGRILGINLLEVPENKCKEEQLYTYGSARLELGFTQPFLFDYDDTPSQGSFFLPLLNNYDFLTAKHHNSKTRLI